MSVVAKGLLYAIPLLALLVVLGTAVYAVQWLSNDPSGPYGGYLALYNPTKSTQPDQIDGAVLYAQNCAHCHGQTGNGQGTTPLGNLVARNFTAEKFKFTDTYNTDKTGGGTPTEQQLVALLKRGIAGSPMPSFSHLSDEQLHAIVDYVTTQFVRPETRLEARKQMEKRKAEDSEEGFDPSYDWSAANLEKWWKDIVANIEPGDTVHAVQIPETADEATLARGEFLFKDNAGLGCAKCHGPEGMGNGPQATDAKFVNDNGQKAFPRDLTAGVYRGGEDTLELYRRVLLGIPGTPMPAHVGSPKSPTPQEDIIAVVQYVKNLAAKRNANTTP